MKKSEIEKEIQLAEKNVSFAEENVLRIKESYKGEPLLIEFYLPSAEYLLEENKKILNELKEKLAALPD